MMGFFNKQNEDAGEQWRKKYLNFFDEQNKVEHVNREKDKLLRQFIVQLSILSDGYDKHLDQILLRVRNHLKNEIDLIVLKSELKIFMESIKNLPQKKKTLKADLLFDFLIRQHTDATMQTALRELQVLVKSEETTINQATDLFIAILNITEPDVPPVDLKLASHENIEQQVVLINVRVMTEQLLQYLTALAIPAAFEPRIMLIKEALLNPEQSPQAFEYVLNDLIELLLKIKEYDEADQQDIDQFLWHVATQLSELNGIITQANASVNDSLKNRNQLDQSVFTQIRELQIQTIKSTSIDSLKEMVNQCFKTIATDIKTHHQLEKQQQQEFQDHMAVLVNKMVSLELESKNLKAELQVMHSSVLT